MYLFYIIVYFEYNKVYSFKKQIMPYLVPNSLGISDLIHAKCRYALSFKKKSLFGCTWS